MASVQRRAVPSPPRRTRGGGPAQNDAADVTGRVAEAFRALRKARGYSLEDVAALTDVSRATLSQIETNKTNPTIGVLWKIATGLGVHDYDALMSRD